MAKDLKVYLRHNLLILGDVSLSVVAVCAGFIARFGELPTYQHFSSSSGMRLFLFASILVFSSFIAELYNHDKNTGKKEILVRISITFITSFFLLSALYYMMPPVMFGRGMLALSLGTFSVLQFLWHVSYRIFFNLPGLARRVLVLGTGSLANQIGGVITTTNHNHVLTGFVNCDGGPVNVPINSILRDGKGLVEIAKKQRAHKLVISLSERRGVLPLSDVLCCKLNGIDVLDAPSFYEQMTGKLLVENITPSWFIFSDGFRITSTMKFLKRQFDVLMAIIGLLVASPLIPLIAIVVKLDSRGPVFYRQERVGQGERNFVLYKFRTMRDDAEKSTGAVWTQKSDPRITRVGKFLRKTRLDELPQLYTVLKGDMSFVGPRPERPEFVEKLKEIIPYYSERHSVKPGITGWAQIKYPYGASVEDAIEKLRYDLFYIKHLSIVLDLLIILETIKVVLFGWGGR